MPNKNILDTIEKMEYEVDAIKEAYDLLYMLEVENKKNTAEYEYATRVLKSCLDLEDETLSNLLTKEDAEEVYNYLSKKYNLPIYFQINPLESDDKLPHVRTMNKIYTYLYKMMPKENYAGFEFSSALYQLSINLDLLRLTMSFLDKSKEGLKVKYNLSFTIGELEEELLANNFTLDDNPYLTRNILTYNDVLKEKGLFLTNSTIINTLRAYLLSLFSFKNGFETDNKRYADYLFVCASIRACLVMFDTDTANLIISKLKEFLKGCENYYLPKYPNFNKDNLLILLEDLENSLENERDVRKTINTLDRLLNEYEKDLMVPRHVSLGL